MKLVFLVCCAAVLSSSSVAGQERSTMPLPRVCTHPTARERKNVEQQRACRDLIELNRSLREIDTTLQKLRESLPRSHHK